MAAENRSAIRSGVAGLTTRGRAFLAAGAGATLCAFLFGQQALLRIGVLLAVLPLASALMLARTRYRVASGRQLLPRRVAAGQEARVHLRIDNVSRMPTGLLLLEDRVPYLLGPSPRFMLDRMEARDHPGAAGHYREVSYRVRSELRGRYPLGPLRLRLTDPFGLCELTRSFTVHDVLTVLPRVQALPPVGLTGEWTGHGESNSRTLALSGDDDVIPREYRQGDELRRVHWKSTARYGELMVRREEQPRQARATVLLDTRAIAHQGSGPASSFEWAVSCAASVGTHLIERGYRTRLLTDTGLIPAGPGGDSTGAPTAESAGLLLDALAVVQPSAGRSLAGADQVLRVGGEGLLVAVLGSLDEEQLTVVRRLRRRSRTAVAFLLDPTSWSDLGRMLPGSTGAPAQAALREAGWTVLAAGAGDSVPELWRRAGLRSDGAARTP